MPNHSIRTVMSEIIRADVESDPFPHFIVPSVLSPAHYAELSNSFPTYSTIMRGRTDDQRNVAVRLPYKFVVDNRAVPEVWRDFFDAHVSTSFWRDILKAFHEDFQRLFPAIENQMSQPMARWQPTPRGMVEGAYLELDCQFVINTPSEQTSTVKTCHVDRETTIFSALYYMRNPEDRATGGDLDLFRWKRSPRFFGSRQALPSDVERAKSVPYDENTLVGFPNHPSSIHGVSPRGPSVWPRRYINLIATVSKNAFRLPQAGLLTKLFSGSEMRNQVSRSVADDRY